MPLFAIALFLCVPPFLQWLGMPNVLAFTAMAICIAISRHALFRLEVLAGAPGAFKWLTDSLFMQAIAFLMYASGISIGQRHEALGAILIWAGIGIQIAALLSVWKTRGAK